MIDNFVSYHFTSFRTITSSDGICCLQPAALLELTTQQVRGANMRQRSDFYDHALNACEVAALLGVSQNLVYNLAKEG